MNRKQLTLIIVLGVVIGGLGWMAYKKKAQPYKDSTAKMGGKVLPGFPVNDVDQISIKQPKAEITVARKNDLWVVKDRGDYPANFDTIRDLILKFSEAKVAKPLTVGPSRLPMLELVPPDKGAGTLVEFKDKSGKLISSVLLGAKSMREGGGGNEMFGGGGGSPNGRYLMVGTDVSTAVLVTEPFSSAEAKAEDWLNKEWFKVEKHKTISVVTTNATNNWKLVRETDAGEWKLADTKPGETLDNGKSGVVTTSFNYPQFADLATNPAPAVTGLAQPAITATIETFDGFTYTAKIGGKSGEENFYFQFSVAGNFPKERAPGKDEKPEDKPRLDKEFADDLKKRDDKLKAEQAFGKWTYVVSKFSIDPLLKARAELLADKKEDAKPAEAGAAPPLSLPPAAQDQK